MFQSDYYAVQSINNRQIEANVRRYQPKSIDFQLALYDISVPIICVIIIIINAVIVISSGLILRRLRGLESRSTYIFLGNIALSNLLIGVTTLIDQYYPYICNRTEMMCAVGMGLIVSSTISSVYTIGLIAIDRYIYIFHGLQYQRYVTSNRARVLSVMTWLLGIIIGFLPAMGFRNFTDNGRLCWYTILVPRELILITTIIGMIPLIMILVLYSLILKLTLNNISERKLVATNIHTALRSFRGGQQQQQPVSRRSSDDEINNETYHEPQISRRKKSQNSEIRKNIQPAYNPSKWKSIKFVFFATSSYLITWFPFSLATCLFVFCNPAKTPIYCNNLRIAIASPLIILGLINSIINPIIYTWWHKGFRESIKKIYMKNFRKQSNSQLSGSGKTNRTSARARKNFRGDAAYWGVRSGELETIELDQNIRKSKKKLTSSRHHNQQNFENDTINYNTSEC